MTRSPGSQPGPDPLLDLLAECVVRVDVGDAFAGTGFYVAPDEVLTCAHVVHGGKSITVADRLPAHPITVLLPPEDSRAHRFYPQPDAVLLRVPNAPHDHPCVRLADQRPAVTDRLHLTAWIKSEHARDRVAQSGATLVMETVFDEDGWTLYKLRDGQVIRGFSGGPLLNRRTGDVCALIEATRAERANLGGFGVPVAAIATLDRELLGRNAAFHTVDQRWARAVELQRVAEQERAGQRVAAEGQPTIGAAASTVREDHLREVRDLIAPSKLIGRAAELAELTRFCAGTKPYAWWQAEPWAGKTALTSSFVLDPPDWVDVVSFFVTRRLYGRQHSDDFRVAIASQLAELLGGPQPQPGAIRYATVSRLLDDASARSWEAGRRLLLVVDGLDEDRSAELGLNTIAAYLPRRPPAALRVLVTGRPNLGLPLDDLADHPLRTVSPRMLMPSAHATRLEEKAYRELHELIGGHSAEHEKARNVIGLVAAAGGGLTRADAEELIGEPLFVLDGELARTIEQRGPDRVLLFAHDTLRSTALRLLGGWIARWAQRIDTWAHESPARGWPADTPDYLLRRYVTQLVERDELARAAVYTADPARHERLRARRGGDLLARTETAVVLRALANQNVPDLTAMVQVAAQWRPPTSFPRDLPAAWLLLGERGHTAALLEDMADYEQIAALCKMIDIAALAEDADRVPAWGERAATLATQRVHPSDRSVGLRQVTRALAAAGHKAQAARIVEGIDDIEDRRFTELAMIEGLICAGDVDDAERRTFAAPVPKFVAPLWFQRVGRSLALAGRVTAAELVLAELPDARLRLPVHAAIGTALIARGCTAEAFAVAAAMLDADTAAEVSAAAACDLVQELANVDPEQAQPLTDRVTAALDGLPDRRRDGTVVEMLLDIGRPDIVEAMATQGDAFVATRRDLVKVGEGYAAAGEVDDALRIAQLLTDDRDRHTVQAAAACAAAQAGDARRARALASQVESDAQHVADPSVFAANLEPLARSLALVLQG